MSNRWDGAQDQSTQVISPAGTGDHLSILQIASDRDWLVLGATGTPVGPQPNDTVGDQDFRGAVLIYRVDENGQWQLTQTLLSQWTPWQTNIYKAILHTDTSASASDHRFYRALILP